MEFGEPAVSAARREALEETGLSVAVHPRPVFLSEALTQNQSGELEYHYVLLHYLAFVNLDRASNGVDVWPTLTPDGDVDSALWIPTASLEVSNGSLQSALSHDQILLPIVDDVTRRAIFLCQGVNQSGEEKIKSFIEECVAGPIGYTAFSGVALC